MPEAGRQEEVDTLYCREKSGAGREKNFFHLRRIHHTQQRKDVGATLEKYWSNQAKTIRWTIDGWMLGQRRRRRTNIEPTMDQRIVSVETFQIRVGWAMLFVSFFQRPAMATYPHHYIYGKDRKPVRVPVNAACNVLDRLCKVFDRTLFKRRYLSRKCHQNKCITSSVMSVGRNVCWFT